MLAGIQIENIGNFGLYGRRMVDTLLQFREQEVFLPIMVSLSGFETEKFQVDRDERLTGNSSYGMMRLIRLAGAIVIRFSDRPLKFSVFSGLLLSLISALASVLLLIAWSLGLITVPGWTSTMLSVWFLSGLIMATLGIHGFYLGRIFAEAKNRPRIIVDKVTYEEEASK